MSGLSSRVAASRVLWEFQLARREQLPPEGDWSTWLLLAGRGFGKTRSAAEWLAWRALRLPGSRWAVVAPTFADVRDTCLEGESGLLSVLERYGVLRGRNPYNRSMGEVFLENGARVKAFSGDEPDRLRGPQHHGAWVDELAAFKYPDTWDQLQFGLRLGQLPQTVVTTTPRPVGVLRKLLLRTDGTVVVSRGSTFDNRANLAPAALAELLARYDGTRIGRQELYGELLEDVLGALWSAEGLNECRVDSAPDLVRVVVGVDPAVSDTGDETGIVVAGRDARGEGFVLEDASLRGTPDVWARKVVEVFDRHLADAVVVEVNQGGQMVAEVLRTVRPSLPIREVRATKGKLTRAEPISAMYEQGRVHHVGKFLELEEQMVTWSPAAGKSPDRMDALVWAFTELLHGSGSETFLAQLATFCVACQYPNRKQDRVCVKCGAGLPEV